MQTSRHGRSPISRTSGFAKFAKLAAAVLFGGVLAAHCPPRAAAQTSEATVPTEIETIIDAARDGGATIVIIQPGAADATGEGTSEVERSPQAALSDQVVRARSNLLVIVGDVPEFSGQVLSAIASHSQQGSAAWPIITLLITALFLAIGYGVEFLFRRWARPYFSDLFNPQPRGRAEKISYVLFRGAIQSVGVALQCLTALVLVYAADGGVDHVRTTALIVVAGVGLVRLLSVFFQNVFVPYAPSHRLLNLTDDDARKLHRQMNGVLGAIAVAFGLCLWMEALSLHDRAYTLGVVLAMGLAALLIAVFTIRNRQAIAGMILGAGDESSKPAALRVFARLWHVAVLIYVVAAFATTTVRLLTGAPGAFGLVVAPVLLVFAAIAVNGVALLLIEWAFTRRKAQAIAAGAEGLPENLDPARPGYGLQGLAEHAAGLIIIAGTIWLVVRAWGIDLTQRGTVLHNVWEILLIGFLAYVAYEAVKVTIDRKIAEEVGDEEDPEPGEEGGAKGASRLGTLLPLFRNFLVILIFAIAAMIALSELGVDIGPLFAGAGIVGVAIGFGSQALVRDIFSGTFFLIDDAFRKGEYIEIGNTRGTVEKISVRSMQLRHHMGRLHTIPFGEITQLTNWSRDWVMMKLPLRVPYDTDVEQVRKLIKKLGQELLEHPELGDKFLQPLKSQGVYQMEDSAMIIRVKYMTKPGDQFEIRKLVYAKIRELFEENGIRFAHREVTVRLADTPAAERLSEAEREAVAGAVRPLIDDGRETAAGAGTGEDR